jgi:hypothetical protein
MATCASVTAQQPPPAGGTATPVTTPATIPENDRVVVTGAVMVPVPDVGEGAAYYAPGELEAAASEAGKKRLEATSSAIRCADVKPGQRPTPVPMFLATLERLFRNEVEASVRAESAAKYAADATKAAEASRHDAARGLVDMKTVEAAELTRQAAVTKAVEAREKLEEARDITADAQTLYLEASLKGREARITWGELDFRALQRRASAAKAEKEFRDLLVTGVVTQRQEDRRGEYLHVTGVIRNNRTSSAKVPDLRVAALDREGWVLKAETAQHGGSRLNKGSAVAFAYDLRPTPEMVDAVVVSFASKFAPPPRLSPSHFDQCRTE